MPPIAAPATSGNWYASVFAGGGTLQTVETVNNEIFGGYSYGVEFDAGYVVGMTVGRRINKNWRVEGELSYAGYKSTTYSYDGTPGYNATGPLNAAYLLANVWFDIPNSSRFTPYVGGGLGMAKVDGDINLNSAIYGYGAADAKFAYQVGAGVSYGINDRMTLDVGYRYKAVDGVDFNDIDTSSGDVYQDGDVHTHTLQAGLRFDF